MRSRRSMAAATAVLTDTPTGQTAGELTDVAYLPDGSALTTGRQGSVRWTPKSGGQSTEIASIPVYTGGSLGLTSIAVAPDYATSRTIYTARALSTGGGERAFRVSKWQAEGTGAPTGLTGEKPVLQIPVNSDNRGIQDLAVDPSGADLWVAVGDNAADQAPETATKDTVDKFALRALDPGQPTGKILRVNTNGVGVSNNPFYDKFAPDSWRSRTYLSGLRDPRLTLDQRGGIVVTDNGWAARNEVNIALPGQNLKWPCWEGNGKTPGYRDLAECGGVLNTAPLTETARQANSGLLGGVFYAGQSYPESYRARHFVADKGAGTLSTLSFDSTGRMVDQPAALASGIGTPAAIATAPNGDIVVADASTSALRRLSYRPANKAPTASFDVTVEPVTRRVWFDASTSTDPDFDNLDYEWDFGDGGAGTGGVLFHVYDPAAEKGDRHPDREGQPRGDDDHDPVRHPRSHRSHRSGGHDVRTGSGHALPRERADHTDGGGHRSRRRAAHRELNRGEGGLPESGQLHDQRAAHRFGAELLAALPGGQRQQGRHHRVRDQQPRCRGQSAVRRPATAGQGLDRRVA
ncbi:PQQ-dependent sugar dehydrogenase [Amycolatopsis alba]|uniref:PQQ-dependent sugar dehydrogenase n=1 Tax=Amycolatopsis alba TaxID=76020 RepID=UPI0003AA6EAF|nr:PQQ-dependent sugar dehydrogenase [Amycolatopsis alba]